MSAPRSVLGALLGLFLLGGCNTPPPPAPAYPEITFGHLEPYRFEVAKIEVVEEYRPPLDDPHVEHLAPVSPAAIMRRWVGDRIDTVGVLGTVRITITDARIVMIPLKVNESVKDRFTTEQAARYEASAAMLIEVLDERNIVRAHAGGEAGRSQTVPEGLNLRQRDQMLFELTEKLINDLNRVIEPNITRYLGGHLR